MFHGLRSRNTSSCGLFGLVFLSMKSDDEKEVVEPKGDKKKKRRDQSPGLLFVLFEKALFLRISVLSGGKLPG